MPVATSHLSASDYLLAAAAVGGAIGLAALGLFGADAVQRVAVRRVRAVTSEFRAFRDLHSGHVGDYVAWWTAGAAALGAACCC